MNKDYFKIGTSRNGGGTMDTEPGLEELKHARWLKTQREYSSFDSSLLPEDRSLRLESIADELKFRSQAINSQIYEMGRLFVLAKKDLPHGEFTLWVKKLNVCSISKVQNMMHIYKVCLGTPSLLLSFKQSLLGVICRPNFPEELRQFFADNAPGVYDCKMKELLSLQNKYVNGEIDLGSEEVQKIVRRQKGIDVRERYVAEWNALKEILNDRLTSFSRIHDSHQKNPLLVDDSSVETFYRHTKKFINSSLVTLQSLIDNLDVNSPVPSEDKKVEVKGGEDFDSLVKKQKMKGRLLRFHERMINRSRSLKQKHVAVVDGISSSMLGH